MRTPFKMAGMSFKGESPVRKNKVGKFIKSRVDNVKANVKGVVDRVKSIGSGSSGNKTTAEDKADADYYGSNSDKMANNKVNSSKKAQDEASSSIEDTLPKTPMAKRAPTKNYKKGYYKK
jgi:hypothetical protein